jgi:hypothetical protein
MAEGSYHPRDLRGIRWSPSRLLSFLLIEGRPGSRDQSVLSRRDREASSGFMNFVGKKNRYVRGGGGGTCVAERKGGQKLRWEVNVAFSSHHTT